ncbi:hypothetical protein [Nocardioides ultimimeridianus]
MVKGALWLLQEVGVGNVFTKAEIRDAFPGVAQADRRIRDLRDFGWVLHTRADDASLLQEQTRLVAAGAAVWDPKERREASPDKGLSAKERQGVMERDDFMCTICGIAGGEAYPDDNMNTAVLSVMKQSLVAGPGRNDAALVTACKRCKAGRSGHKVDPSRVQRTIDELDPSDRRLIEAWARAGKRSFSPAERAWAMYRGLPPEARAMVDLG